MSLKKILNYPLYPQLLTCVSSYCKWFCLRSRFFKHLLKFVALIGINNIMYILKCKHRSQTFNSCSLQVRYSLIHLCKHNPISGKNPVTWLQFKEGTGTLSTPVPWCCAAWAATEDSFLWSSFAVPATWIAASRTPSNATILEVSIFDKSLTDRDSEDCRCCITVECVSLVYEIIRW